MSEYSTPRSVFSMRFDKRWIGGHGIGRFAQELHQRIPGLVDAGLSGSPSDAIDTFRLSAWLMCHPRARLFTPGFNAPLIGQSRTVIAVHDLNHIDAPIDSGLLKKTYYSSVLRRACRRAPAVITVSDYSRERIVAWSGAQPHRVVNVGNGVSDVFSPTRTGTDAQISQQGSYFLAVSNRKPHKNEGRLFEAFRQAKLPEAVKLLVTGEPTDAQRAWIRGHGMDGRIQFLGAVSDDVLAAYYRSARALLFVSLYEGFGLPAVEAMACNTPVLASNVTSLPEVVGDAAVLVEPTDTKAIRAGIMRFWSEPDLIDRCVSAGQARVQAFKWCQVADRVRRVLARVDAGALR